jgi:hypothetical protein
VIKIEHKQLKLPAFSMNEDDQRNLAFWNSETRNRARIAEGELSIMSCRHHPYFANVIRYTATMQGVKVDTELCCEEFEGELKGMI